jgi:hypothetical protein
MVNSVLEVIYARVYVVPIRDLSVLRLVYCKHLVTRRLVVLTTKCLQYTLSNTLIYIQGCIG